MLFLFFFKLVGSTHGTLPYTPIILINYENNPPEVFSLVSMMCAYIVRNVRERERERERLLEKLSN